MAVTRASKVEELQQLENAFKGTESAILVDYKGLKVPEVTELRRQVRKAKAEYKVVKNTLAKRALKGTAFETLSDPLKAASSCWNSASLSARVTAISASPTRR